MSDQTSFAAQIDAETESQTMTATADVEKELVFKKLNELPLEEKTIKLSDLPVDDKLHCPPPSSWMTATVKSLGVIEPIIVFQFPDGPMVVAGKRRVKASREAMKLIIAEYKAAHNGEEPDPVIYAYIENIKANVYTAQKTEDDKNLARAVALVENHAREGNMVFDVMVIKGMLRERWMINKIAEASGLPKLLLEQVLPYTTLDDRILAGLKEGKVTWGVAKEITKLSTERRMVEKKDGKGHTVKEKGQVVMIDMGEAVAMGQKLTSADVKKAKTTKATKAREAMVNMLPTMDLPKPEENKKNGKAKIEEIVEPVAEPAAEPVAETPFVQSEKVEKGAAKVEPNYKRIIKDLLEVIDLGITDEKFLNQINVKTALAEARTVIK